MINPEEIKSLMLDTKLEVTEELVSTENIINCLARNVSRWTEEQQKKAVSSIFNQEISSPYYKLLVNIFQVDKHIEKTKSHQYFIMKTYKRLKPYFPIVNEFQLEKHDESKYSFKQIIGYTKKFVHFCPWNDEIWQMALQDHYKIECHHPEHKKGKNMPRQYLEESVIDMVACHWERNLDGRPDVKNEELANIQEKFLIRYTSHDKEEAKMILKNIQSGLD